MRRWLFLGLIAGVALAGPPASGHDSDTHIIVHVSGEVLSAEDLEFGINERITAAFAIGCIHGFTKHADLREITVMRRARNGKEQVISVNVPGEREGRVGHALILQDGDTIYVPPKRKYRNRKPEPPADTQ